MLKRLRKLIAGLFGLCDLKKPFDPARFVREAHGIIPGGMYAGITDIGNPDLPWETSKDEHGCCPACFKGTMVFLYQKHETDDSVIDAFYKIRCLECGYVHDTGVRLHKDVNADTVTGGDILKAR